MATAAKKKPKAKRLRQQHLPEMEPLSNKKIDAAALNYEEARDERMALSKVEKDAKLNLLFEMTEAGVDRYETPDGLVVSVTADRDVKVKKAAKPAKDGDSGEAE